MRDALAQQTGLHVGHPAGGLHPGIRHQQHLACTEVTGVIAHAMPATRTKDDFRRDEFTMKTDIGTHATAYRLLI
ncbi:hypothetical protein D3C71_1680020 [compost metagenome]